MGQLTLRVNNQPYTLACRDGEEAQLVALAGYVDDKIQSIVKQVGQVGEARLMLMASLLIADEIKELKANQGVVAEADAVQMMTMAADKIDQVVEQLTVDA